MTYCHNIKTLYNVKQSRQEMMPQREKNGLGGDRKNLEKGSNRIVKYWDHGWLKPCVHLKLKSLPEINIINNLPNLGLVF